MYSFDGTSDAIAEVPNSPWSESALPNYYPFLVAPESTGHYVYLLKFSDPSPGGVVNYVLDLFQIDRTTPRLVPLSSQVLPLPWPIFGAAADPNGHGIAISAVLTDPMTSLTTPIAEVITCDPITGLATIPTSGITLPGFTPTTFALSPQGKCLV